ncbi:protocatechuate 3,4-dioxygenase subunit alpha [Georgenia thermotolerans]|uniref:Protocatechuate 3,4-dioxygenase subunit alpha n=1 Tax=Georgenia thermotolerans TaxID=527326 RepID=A0A7J5UL62_9MICO|nr:protocatechuate 3,4-dioxygenase subunit alpha [Georgenia thermotolerans]KAE8762623.1 protocatechuate 3,4-dioxygenase subunit alpha [Georgenia thermotolerans]
MRERLGLTPSQTVGPYLKIGLDWGYWGRLVVPEGTPGAFWITGRVLDGDGEPIADAMVETWQADPDGRFDHPDDPRGARPSTIPGFTGFGRSDTREEGNRWRIHTVRPGPLPAGELDDPAGPREAPHLDVSVFARGMLDRTVTRIYFPDEPLNATDAVLATVDPARRHTLLAQRDGTGYRFDIRVQGERETVFFQL